MAAAGILFMPNFDSLIVEFDKGLRTLFGSVAAARPRPGEDLPEAELTQQERRHATALMRVNHCGEVCAQALYQGQALSTRNPAVAEALATAAREETDHLDWCAGRVHELGGHLSALNPVWYGGSLAIGVVIGVMGEAWNLGFLEETERQVEAHLEGHLAALPENDARSQAIVGQMKIDEAKHAALAQNHGAHELPGQVKAAMRLASTLMTKTAYWV
jgi:ubiquinone biosynthesis monooxygenase Coq7